MLAQHRENSSVPSPDTHDNSLPPFTLAGKRVHVSLSPCNARTSFHTLSPTPVVVPGSLTANASLSITLSLCAPRGARPRLPRDSTCPPLPCRVLSASCAASTPSTLLGHLLLGVQPAALPARPPHAWRACSTGCMPAARGGQGQAPSLLWPLPCVLLQVGELAEGLLAVAARVGLGP